MRWVLLSVSMLALAACGKTESSNTRGSAAPSTTAPGAGAERLTVSDVAPPPPAPAGGAPAPVAVTLPRIAYSYKYAFRLPVDQVSAAQRAHLALCDRLGPARCQLVSMENDSGDGQVGTASMTLKVDSAIARRFGDQLQAVVGKAGGRVVNQTVAAEDVSKAMTDSQVRISQRAVLVQRLTSILQNRQGPVADLVQAERAVADAQEELDTAKAELADLQGRVATSTIDIGYSASAAATDSGGTVLDSFGQSGSIFVNGVSVILRVLIILAPWALVIGLLVWGINALVSRRLRRFPPRPRASFPGEIVHSPEPPPADPS